jgi:hypothetical protein
MGGAEHRTPRSFHKKAGVHNKRINMNTHSESVELKDMTEDIEQRLQNLESQTNGLDGSLAWRSRCSYPGAHIDSLTARLEDVEAKIDPRHNLSVISLKKDLRHLRDCLLPSRWN